MAQSPSRSRPHPPAGRPVVLRLTPDQRQDVAIEACRQRVRPGEVLRTALETYFSLPEDMR